MKKRFTFLIILLLPAIFSYSQIDECRGLSFHSIYSFDNYFSLTDHFTTSDSSSVFVGHSSPNSGIILKVNSKGAVTWNRKLSAVNQSVNLVNGKELRDKNYIVTGGLFNPNSNISSEINKIFIAKYDTAGNTLWQQEYKVNVPIGKLNSIDYLKIEESKDGSILIGAGIGSNTINNGYKFYLIARLNNKGAVLWSKHFESIQEILLTIPPQIDNSINIFGNFSFTDYSSFPRKKKTSFFYLQLDALSGDILKMNSAIVPLGELDLYGSNFVYGFRATKKGVGSYNLYGAVPTSIGSNLQGITLSFDNSNFTGGFLIKSSITNSNLYSKFICLDTVGNMGFVLVGGGTNAKMFYTSLDVAGKIKSQTTTPIISPSWTSGLGIANNLLTFKAPDIFSFGFPVSLNSKTYLHHFQLQEGMDQSTSACMSTDTSGLISTEAYTAIPYNWTWDAEYSNVLTTAAINVTMEDIPIYKEEICVSKIPPKNYFSLGKDTALCPGDSLQLKTTYPYKSYTWQDETTDSIFTVSSPGMYSLTAQDNCDYKYYDTIKIDHTAPENYFNLGKDTVLCPGSSLQLQTSYAYKSFTWQNNTTDPVFTVSTPGLYSLIAQDNCDYKYYDTIKIDYSTTNLTLENNYLICKGDVARLTLPAGFQSYWWQPQTGVAAKNNVFEFSPDKTTQYIIAAKNAIGCVSTDSITVEVKNCPNKFFMPSAFTPNMDGKNEIFKPFVEGMLLSYKLSIYNRWGNKIFDTDNPAHGWDGKLKGVQQLSEVYIWVSQYQFKGEQMENKKGSFVLIR